MAGMINNLYPPIVNTYSPTFVINKQGESICRIYFSLSSYNSSNDIRNVQITFCNQKTNATVFNKTKYPSGIKIINYADFKLDKSKYYIEIPSVDIEGNFQINQYYKIQLRFSAVDFIPTDPINPGQNMDSWLATNAAFFSEWSTICLVRGISKPHLDLLYFKNSEDTSMILAQHTLSVVGSLTFEDLNEKDTLKSYQAKLYDTENNLIADSGIIYSNIYNNINELNYVFKKQLEDGMQYILHVTATTRNLYTITQEYQFSVIQTMLDAIDAEIELESDHENGSIRINLVPTNTNLTTGQIVFRRTSSRSNFTVWEDIHTIDLIDEHLDYSWIDNTIESGIWYKYCVQRKDRAGNRGVASVSQEPIMIIFDDMFFCAESKQLRIRYNPQVTSYKKNISESKTETIGSKYPFIKRNGAIEYRQFAVSGLITLNTDYQDDFTSRQELLGNNEVLQLYDVYNDIERINNYNDYIHEREFREAVMDFLYADNVKLMRTTTEGNILVKLMDINFTPEQALGRMIYSFSATAYEIDNYTFENLIKYHINDKSIIIEDFKDRTLGNNLTDKAISKDLIKNGQLIEKISKDIDILQNILTKKYSYLASSDYVVVINNIKNLKLEFNMPPYLIHENNVGMLVPLLKNEKPDSTTVLGYIVKINGENIYVSPEGIYTLYDIPIISLSFPVETKVTMDYMISITKKENLRKTAAVTYFSNCVGQLWESFNYSDSIFQRLFKKYNQDYKVFYQKLISINGLRIEANPGTVCWIKDSSSSNLKRFVLNHTGLLSLYDDHTILEGCYLSGVHLDPATEDELKRDSIPHDKFIETNEIINTFNDIVNPINNGVYTVNNFTYGADLEPYNKDTALTSPENVELIADNIYALLIQQIKDTKKYIFYQGKWCPFSETHDVLCNVDAIIDYWGSVLKGVYK